MVSLFFGPCCPDPIPDRPIVLSQTPSGWFRPDPFGSYKEASLTWSARSSLTSLFPLLPTLRSATSPASVESGRASTTSWTTRRTALARPVARFPLLFVAEILNGFTGGGGSQPWLVRLASGWRPADSVYETGVFESIF